MGCKGVPIRCGRSLQRFPKLVFAAHSDSQPGIVRGTHILKCVGRNDSVTSAILFIYTEYVFMRSSEL